MWQPGSLIFDEDNGDVVLKDADDIVVASEIYQWYTTAGGEPVQKVDVENGRLFAAAPDLLEALTTLLAEIEGRTDSMDYSRELVLNAIAKATGEDN